MPDALQPIESPAAPLLRYLLAPLSVWLDDPSTEDVAINRPGEAWVRAHGCWTRYDVALDFNTLAEIAILSGSLRKQDVGDQWPLLASELPNGERLQVCLPPAVLTGTVSLTIRKPSIEVAPISSIKRRHKTEGWNRFMRRRQARNLDPLLALFDEDDIEGFVEAAVKAKLNIILAGATGSGKTILSKSMLTAIPDSERLVTIEDTIELVIKQPNCGRLLYSKDGLQGTTVQAKSLLEASLRMRPDRVILQELREPEAAWVWLNEVSAGHPGSVCTLHGDDASTAFKRLLMMIKGSDAGRNFDDGTVTGLLSDAIDVIMPMHNTETVFSIGSTWFVADAARRKETAADLLREDDL